MKLLRALTLHVLLITVFAISANTLVSKELPAYVPFAKEYPAAKEIDPENFIKSSGFLYKSDNNQMLSNDIFFKLDSLQNAYSYFSNRQQPFVYHAGTNTLITLLRGAQDAQHPSTNTLNNLFFRTSNDWGKTWTQPVLVYNSRMDPSGAGARYPSVYPFVYAGEFSFVYTAPVTDGDGWKGFINGLYYQLPITTHTLNINVDGQVYGFGTDAQIVGGVIGDDPFGIAVSGAMPPGGNQWSNNSNLAYRRSTQFDTWEGGIPQAWRSSNFTDVDQDSSRTSTIFGLKKLDDGRMYFAAFGAFRGDEWERPRAGVSMTNSYNDTWTEFSSNENIMPYSLVRNYVTALGVDPETIFIPYGSKDFVVWENGDYSFALVLHENVDVTIKPYEEQIHQIIEIHKTGGVWGIRKVADVSGYTLAYIRDGQQSTNQMDVELQMSRTVDGNYVMCKWVDFVGLETDNSTTDVFVNVREVGANTWGRVTNVTNSEVYDRVTWIPDLIPNDLEEIPLLKCMTVPVEWDTPEQARLRQRELEVPQYVMMGHFNATSAVSVEETLVEDAFEVLGIFPNPVVSEAYVDFILPSYGQLSIEVYNLIGQKVKTIVSGEFEQGMRSAYFDVNNLSDGAYYLVLTFNGHKVTRMLNVIK